VNALQWALLLLGVGIAVMLIFSSRREKKALERLNTPGTASPASRDWGMERPSMTGPREEAAGDKPAAAFDEFGVSKPRKVPSLGTTLPPGTKAPDLDKTRENPIVTLPPAAPEKVIGFYIAEHEGTNILGPKIHAALTSRGLRFGLKKIYHRYDGEQPIFSVASLTKPGSLDPAEAEGFATPGLSVFMVLPGAKHPLAAFQDMLDTARGLAKALNAELYDTEQRAPLTVERERALHLQVEEWAKRNTPAGRLSV
jgi:cell division protein ZipA